MNGGGQSDFHHETRVSHEAYENMGKSHENTSELTITTQ